MEEKYADLIAAFSAVALFALILIAAGGWLLMRKSTAPIERSIAHMRRFMADAAHELRTPISVARTRAEVALEKPRDAAAYELALRGIAAETSRIGKIVEDLLTLSRVDAGEDSVARNLVYLDDVVADAASAASILAAPRNIVLEMQKFEETRVIGDAELLRQLVLILLDNAIKFSPEGSTVSLRIGIVDGLAELEVADQGPGIPAEHLPHIFERFFRGDIARTKTHGQGLKIGGQGAGLGLSIAQWIADAHGGSILVKPGAAGGSRFMVRLPAAAPNVS
jgi:signal transduction histidine kinase